MSSTIRRISAVDVTGSDELRGQREQRKAERSVDVIKDTTGSKELYRVHAAGRLAIGTATAACVLLPRWHVSEAGRAGPRRRDGVSNISQRCTPVRQRIGSGGAADASSSYNPDWRAGVGEGSPHGMFGE
jgi:hypothetical protein